MIRLSHNLEPQRAQGGFAAVAGGQPAWAGTEQFVRQSAKRAWAEKARTAGTGGTSVSLAGSSLRVVNPLKEAGWDERVRLYPAAGVFHGSAWAAVLAETYPLNPCYLVFEADGRELGLLPLMEARGFFGRRRAVSLPFTDACPPLLAAGSDESAVGAKACCEAGHWPVLWGKLAETSASRRWRRIELRGCPPPAPNAVPSEEHFGHTLDLTVGPEAIESGYDASVRRAIRKSAKEDLRVEFRDDLASVQAYYEMHCETRRRHGLPPQPFKFFQSLWRHLLARGQGFVSLAMHQGKPVAGAVFLHNGLNALYKFGASREAFQHLRANNALFSQSIRHCCHQGIKSLDFGRTSLLNEGLRRFKLGWGTMESRVIYHKYDVAGQSWQTARNLTEGWHNRVFRALPVPVSRWIGALLYRHAA